MSEDEIEAEKRAILEQLGDGTGELLRRVQEARLRKEAKEKDSQEVVDDHVPVIASPAPRGLAAKPGVLRVKSLENMGQSGTSYPPLFALSLNSTRSAIALACNEQHASL